MGAEIDRLELQVQTQATKANSAIDTLIRKLGSLNTSLTSINSGGLKNIASGVDQLNASMQGMKTVKKTDFNRLASSIEKLTKIDSSKLSALGNSLSPLAAGINSLNGANFNSKNLQSLVNSLIRLSNSNVRSLANVNFALIGNSISSLASNLSGASKVQQSTISITNAVAKLASAGDKISIVTTQLPSLGNALNNFIASVSTASVVAPDIVNFTQAIASLAVAGDKTAKTASHLGILATELKKFMQVMSTAPAVNRNVIQMTQALAQLASAGGKTGMAVNSLSKNTNALSKSMLGLKKSFGSALVNVKSFTRQLLAASGIYLGIYGAIRGIRNAIDISSDLTEVQNVVDVTFGNMAHNVEEFAQTSIEQLGMSELSLKQYASRFQSMGTAMGIDNGMIARANSFLNKQTNGYVELSDSMSDVSLNLTKLTADMASFYNVEQADVAEDLAAIFTGQTRPLRTYGLDLTQATLQEWAMKQGLDADIQSMSQAEKTMLRYQYVLANTSAAQGDFARTSNTWANQLRILKEQIKKFASVMGTGLIAAFKPFLQTLNTVMAKVISFSDNVLNALGQIFGWKFEISGGGITDDLSDVSSDVDDAAGSAGDLSDNLGSAANNAKKLKTVTLGIDELNLNSPDDSASDSGSGGSGSGSGSGSGTTGSGLTTTMTRNDTILEAYKSSIDSLYELGEYIGDTLSNVLEGINWDSVYKKAENFGTGLADFLNGLISPRLFYDIGETIINSINTALRSSNAFAKGFDWSNLGTSLASGIKGFISNWDAGLTAETLSNFAEGLLEAATSAIKELGKNDSFEDLGQKLVDFICGIKWADLTWDLYEFFKALSEEMAALPMDLARGIAQAILDKIFGVDVEIKAPKWFETIGKYMFTAPIPVAAVLAFLPSPKDAAERLSEVHQEVQKWLDEKIKPIFSKETWSELGENVRKSIAEKFGLAKLGAEAPFRDIGIWFQGKYGEIKSAFKSAPEDFREKFDSAYKKIQEVFSPIGIWFQQKWSDTKGVFRDVKEYFGEKFDSAYRKIQEIFSPIGTWFQQKWVGVKNVFRDVKEYFGDKFDSAYKKIKEIFTPINTWFQGKWNGVKDVFSDKNVKEFFEDGFQKAYKAVTDIWDAIGGYFKGIANDIIDPIQKAVNGVIDGINWIFDKVSGNKPLKNWTTYPRFASGSSGLPNDTVGVVNDQPGSTYKELIVPPHGDPFIPDGRNVMLPMEKGTKIMPANQTKALMNGMPKFATGIGDFFGGLWEKFTNFTGNVLDYITDPAKIVQVAIDKFTDFSSVGSFFIPLATGAVSKVFDSVVEYVKKLFDSAGGAKVEKAVKWAIDIANDNRHGYDQSNRWGNPDYDCSSLVISAFEQAGIKMKSGGANYTGNIYGVAKNLGFADVTSSVGLGTASGMKRGDILLNRKNHVAIYIGNGKLVQASINELGKVTGGKPGDQTGREILTRPYYNYPWDDVLRYAKAYKSGIGEISLSDLVPTYSVGGFPEDGLFFANHDELVGKFSNGRTSVANNEQITDGIEEAAYRGFVRAMSEDTHQESLMRELINAVKEGKRIVIDGRELVSAYDNRKSRNGFSFT